MKDSNERSKTAEEILLKKVGKLAVAGLKWKSLGERKELILSAMQEYADQEVARLVPSKVKEEESKTTGGDKLSKAMGYEMRMGPPVASSHTEGSEERLSISELRESEHSFPEDYDFENGNYLNRCCQCSKHFVGFKQRVVCKKCISKPLEVKEDKIIKYKELANSLIELRPSPTDSNFNYIHQDNVHMIIEEIFNNLNYGEQRK